MEYLTNKVKETVLKPYFERQNINPTTEQLENIEFFLKATAKVESDERLDAKNGVSSASGLYQYVDDAVITATNRLKRYDSLSGEEWVNDLQKGKLKITDLNKEQQTIVLLGDLMERKGTDARMNKVLKGDIEAMKKFYYEEHHTAPDEPTRKRVDNYFSKKKSITKNKPKVDSQFITPDISIEDVEPNRQEKNVVDETTGLVKDKVDELINKNKTKETKQEKNSALSNQIEQVDSILNPARKVFNNIKEKINKTATKAIDTQRLDFLDSLVEFTEQVDDIEDEDMFKDFSIYKPFAEELINMEKDSIEKDIQKGTGYNDEEYKDLETVKENIRKENPDYTEDDVEEVADEEYNFYRRQVRENNVKSFNENISKAMENSVPQNIFGDLTGNPDIESSTSRMYDKMKTLNTNPKFMSNAYSTQLLQKEYDEKQKQFSNNKIRGKRGDSSAAQKYAAQNSLSGSFISNIFFDYQDLGQKEDSEWINDKRNLNIIELKEKYPFLQKSSESVVEKIIEDTDSIDDAEKRALYDQELNRLQMEANIGDSKLQKFTNNIVGGLLGDAPLLLVYGGGLNTLNSIGRALNVSKKATNYMSLNLLSPTSTTKRVINSAVRSSAIEAPLYGYTLQQLNPDEKYNPVQDFAFNFGFDVFGGALTRTPSSYTTITGRTETDYVNSKVEKSKKKAQNYEKQKEVFDDMEDSELYNEVATLPEQRNTFFSMDEEINVIDGNSSLNNNENIDIINRQKEILSKKENITQEDFDNIQNDVELLDTIIENENIKETEYQELDIDSLIEEKNLLLQQFDNDSKTVRKRYENISEIDFKQRHEDIKRYGEIVKVIDNYNTVQLKNELRKVLDAEKRGKNLNKAQKSAENTLNNFQKFKQSSRFTNTPYNNDNSNFDLPNINELKRFDSDIINSKNNSKQKVKENIKDIEYNNKVNESKRNNMIKKAGQANKLQINESLNKVNTANANLEKTLNNDIIRLEKNTEAHKTNVELSEQRLKEIRKKYGC